MKPGKSRGYSQQTGRQVVAKMVERQQHTIWRDLYAAMQLADRRQIPRGMLTDAGRRRMVDMGNHRQRSAIRRP